MAAVLLALACLTGACFQLDRSGLVDGGAPGSDAAGGDGGGGAVGAVVRCEHRSGTRLTVSNMAVDSVNTIARVYDQQLESFCAPTRQAGTTVCVPSGIESLSIWYLDAGCQSAVLALATGAAAPTARFVRDLNGSPSVGFPYFELGDPVAVAPGTAVYDFNGSGEGCNSLGTTLEGQFYAATSAADRFVELSRVPVPTTARFEFRALVSADGARLCSSTLQDRELGLECSPRVAKDGSVRCLPLFDYNISVRADTFGDAGCTAAQPVALIYPDADEVPRYATTEHDFSACPQRNHTYRIDDPWTEPVYFSDGPDRCYELMLGVSFLVAEEIDSAALLGEFQRSPRETSGRLAQLDFVSPEGVSVPSGLFRDQELGLDCNLAFGQRCLPIDFYQEHGTQAYHPSDRQFSDPACTQEIELAYTSGSCAAGGAPAFGVGTEGVYPVLSSLTAPVYYLDASSACSPAGDPSAAASPLFVLGDRLPESTWAVAYEP